MRRATSAILIGGARHTIKPVRGACPARSVATRNLLEGTDAEYKGRRATHNAFNPQESAQKYKLDPSEGHVRGLSTSTMEAITDSWPESTLLNYEKQIDGAGVKFAPRMESIWTRDFLDELAKLRLNQRRREIENLVMLKEGEPFYEKLSAYQEHFKALLLAEQEDAKKTIQDRLSQLPIEYLVEEGYTLLNLSAFVPRQRSEKNVDEHMIQFSPRAGQTLGDNLFTRGVQVTIVETDQSPLDSGVQDQLKLGVVCHSSPEKVVVRLLEKTKDFDNAKIRWRLDLSLSDVGYLRALEAMRAFNYDPESQRSVPAQGEEIILRGTSLRKELLGTWRPPTTSSNQPIEIAHGQEISDTASGGAFANNERVVDWARRYSLPNPERREGDPDIQLNTTQIQAIAQMLQERVSLIQGPPGTGKTRTIIEAVRLLKSHFRVPEPLLICTFTNVAVDNLVEGIANAGLKPLRIGVEDRIEQGLEKWTMEAQLKKHKRWGELLQLRSERDNQFTAVSNLRKRDKDAPEKAKSRSKHKDIMIAGLKRLRSKVGALKKDMEYDIFREADVVCTTCLSAGSLTMNAMDFPVVFLDEASMSTEPASLIPLMRGCKHLALIGDHKQLPPVITSGRAQDGGLSESLFERLIRLNQFPNIMLDIQYRMHPTISAFPRNQFYGSALKDGTVLDSGAIPPTLMPPRSRHLSSRRIKSTDPVAPLLFIHHEHREMAKDRSKVNIHETQIVVAILEDLLLLNPELKGSNIGVIAPYLAQIRMLNAMLKGDHSWEAKFQETLGDIRALQMKDIEVKTVDGFEGREKDVIIFSTVRNNSYGCIGFLADRRRMNVALTRAKRALFVIGNMKTLSKAKFGPLANGEAVDRNVAKMMDQGNGDEWRKYIQFVLAENLFMEMDHPFEYRSVEEMVEFERATNGPPSSEDRLIS